MEMQLYVCLRGYRDCVRENLTVTVYERPPSGAFHVCVEVTRRIHGDRVFRLCAGRGLGV